MIKKILLFITILFITGCSSDTYKTIDSNEAMKLIENGAIIVDVREISEYEINHIPNSINIPLNNIESINYNKDSTIIVYCATGVRSSQAALKLHSLGYTNIYNLDGGIINWGFELEE